MRENTAASAGRQSRLGKHELREYRVFKAFSAAKSAISIRTPPAAKRKIINPILTLERETVTRPRRAAHPRHDIGHADARAPAPATRPRHTTRVTSRLDSDDTTHEWPVYALRTTGLTPSRRGSHESRVHQRRSRRRLQSRTPDSTPDTSPSSLHTPYTRRASPRSARSRAMELLWEPGELASHMPAGRAARVGVWLVRSGPVRIGRRRHAWQWSSTATRC